MFSKKPTHKTPCLVMHLLIAALLLLVSLLSLLGVFLSHILTSTHDGVTTTTLAFGTSSGSLSIIAFAVSVTCFLKQLKASWSKCEACSSK